MNIFKSIQNSLMFFPDDGGFDPGNPIDLGGDDGADDGGDDTEFEESIVEDGADGSDPDDDSEDDGEEAGEESDKEEDDKEDDEKDEDDEKVVKKKDKDKDKEEDEDEVDPTDPSVNANIIREAAKKFPGVFKQFPELKAAFFFGRNVRAMFPTIEDAAEAHQTVQNFEFIQKEVASGNPDSIVEFLGKDQQKLFRFAKKLNDGLAKNNPIVYANLTAPVIANVVRQMRKEATLHKNENLGKVADWVAKYVFDDVNLPDDPKLPEDREDNPEVNRLLAKQHSDFRSDVAADTSERVKNLVNQSFAKLKASPAIKRTIIRDTTDIISNTIGADKAHVAYMNTLWAKARRDGFTRQAASRIREAYLDAVKRVAPGAREKALKQNGFSIKKTAKTPIKVKAQDSTNRVNGNKPVKTSSGGRKKDTSGMTEVQFLEHLERGGE